MSFPYYSNALLSKPKIAVVLPAEPISIKQVEFKIKGMSCESCTKEVDNEIANVNGVLGYTTTLKSRNSIIKFNPKITTADSIATAINKTGYTVVSVKEIFK